MLQNPSWDFRFWLGVKKILEWFERFLWMFDCFERFERLRFPSWQKFCHKTHFQNVTKLIFANSRIITYIPPLFQFLQPVSQILSHFAKPKCDKTFYILWPSVLYITCNRNNLKPTYFGAYIEAEFVTKLSKKVRNL